MKVLVLGGNGMLGNVVVRHFVNKGHEVTFTVRDKMPSWMPMTQRVSVLKFDARKALPPLVGYDFVINCIGNIKQKKDLKAADFYQLNAVFPWKLALACKKAGTRLIHISSDCVFNGKLSMDQKYHPLAPKDAEDDYGVSKALGEPMDAVVVRTSIIGPSSSGLGLFEWYRNLTEGPARGFTNHIWSGVTTLFLAQFIESMLTNPEIAIPEDGGLIQIASPAISKYTLLKIIEDVFGGVGVERFEDMTPVNRALDGKTAPEIHAQLVELKDWMLNND